MNRKRVSHFFLVLFISILMLAVSSTSLFASHSDARFQVTLTNLTSGQPFSPPVAATHKFAERLFVVGTPASAEIEAIAENGDQSGAVALFSSSPHVTEVVDVGMPLTPYGTTFGDFTDTVTFEISAQRGDRLSIAGMLICTNDGIVGADGLRLPRRGEATYYLNGYDAGTEANTEASSDLVDPCSALGPNPLAGDPNGNENDAVDTYPAGTVQLHAGIVGNGDLNAAHDWNGAAAMITIERID